MVSWYKKAQSNSFEDMFPQIDRAETLKDLGEDRKTLVNEVEKTKGVTITLFRNFDANMNEIEKDASGNLILSPRKSEQGVIWFAHSLQRQPEQYYDRGKKYLLTYPLQASYRYIETTYNDGSTSQEPMTEGDVSTENSFTWIGYQLPEGFKFSYKTQKHIICEKDLMIPPNYIKEVNNELV